MCAKEETAALRTFGQRQQVVWPIPVGFGFEVFPAAVASNDHANRLAARSDEIVLRTCVDPPNRIGLTVLPSVSADSLNPFVCVIVARPLVNAGHLSCGHEEPPALV